MRLPFLQVHQDDLARGRILARILRIPDAHASGIVVLLDAWALGETEGGVIVDTDPAGAIALAVGWDGDSGALLAGLVRVRLVDEVNGAFRVVSTDRYTDALAGPTKRTESARIAAIERWHGKKDAPRMLSASDRNATGMRIDAKTQTQTQTQKKEELPLPSSAAPVEQLALEPKAAPRRAKKPKPQKPTDPRHAPLTAELVALGWPHHGGRTAKAISQLLELAAQGGQQGDAGHHEVVRRASIARVSDGFPRVRELHELADRWGHFEHLARSQGPPRQDPNAGIGQSNPEACAACGSGDTADYGGTRLCYGSPVVGAEPGCAQLWQDAVESGEWKPEDVAEWARRRMAT